MPYAYPLLLDISDRLVVIIGGGAVAARKASGVLAAGGKRVRCIAPHFGPDLPTEVERISEEYAKRHLEGAALVFAATDRADVNEAVVRDCRQLGIWVNRADADEAEPGDFVTPAKFEQGAVIVAVSAGSAALAASLRDHIARNLDTRYLRMAEAMRGLRPAIRASANLSPVRRAQVFRDLATEEALAVLEAEGIDSLRDWLVQRYPELTHV